MLFRDQVIFRIALLAKEMGGPSRFAKSIGVSSYTIASIIKGRRDPGPKVLAAIGLEKKVVVWYDSKR